jgi:tellurite resistance protein TerC
MDVPIAAWVAVTALILGVLMLDLFVFHRNAHEISMKEAGLTSAVWVALGLSFGGVIWYTSGGTYAGEYLAGYLIEKSLSVDNIFVFALLLGYFNVPAKYQHRVLFWGVLGALVFRAIFIALGAALLENFHWTIYVFGAFLVITGVKMATHSGGEVHPEKNFVLKAVRKVIPITNEYEGQRFFVKKGVKRYATPMFAVLIAVETTDVLFAVDSIPAIFAITDEPFLVFTSNAFAILGLRALYFLLAGAMNRFIYLKVGLAAVLVFVGAKMLLSEVYHFPIWGSLLAIATMLAVSVMASLRATRGGEVLPDPLHATGDKAPLPPPD